MRGQRIGRPNKCVVGALLMRAKPSFEPKNCGSCQNTFTPIRKWQRFCSDKCRWISWGKNNKRVALKKDQLSEISAVTEGLINGLTEFRRGLNL
jgi:endogenous inhibitor of DNA gyrase (YacG/DUF329 family)